MAIILVLPSCGFKASISQMIGSSDTGDDPSTTPTPIPGSGALNVTIDQSLTQPDPTATLPVRFVITFSESIDPSTFDLNDLTITGTAGDHKTFYLDASSFASAGVVNVFLDSQRVTSSLGQFNNAAQIVDNEVTFASSVTPHVFKNINVGDQGSLPSDFMKIGDYIVFSASGFRSYNSVSKQFENVDTTKPVPTRATYLGELAG